PTSEQESPYVRQGADAAIVDSGYTRHYASLNAWDYRSEFVDVNWLVSTLARAGISAAVITDHDLEIGALRSYRALVLPSTSCVSQLAAENIGKFAEAGGRVFATFDTSLRDDFWRLHPDYELTKIMGARYVSTEEVDADPMIASAGSHPIFRGLDSTIPVPRQRGLVNRVNHDALVLAKWSDGRLAMTETRYGVYCSENLFSAENTTTPEVAALITNTIGYLVNVKYGAQFNLGQLKTKAAWYTPPADRHRIAHDLQRLAATGFNTLFVSAFSQGQAIYPSQAAERNPAYGDFDPLQACIEAGRPLGLSVHAWAEAFDAGQAAKDGSLPRLLQLNPGWAAMKRDDRGPAATPDGHYFLSPAHPKVQQFVMDIARELVTCYALDGIHLGSVCYPAGKAAPYDYNPTVLELAEHDLGFTPRSIGLDIAKWNAWFDWKCSNLNAFAGRLVSMIREASPGTLVSASVYPYPDSVLVRMQDWSKWAVSGWLDFVVPLTNTRVADLVDTLVRAAQGFAGAKTLVVAGIDAASIPNTKSSAPALAGLVDAARAAGAYGVSIYDARALSDEALSALLDGPFRAPTE
ncbi:MAG: family 10 glycosylhydrolase, partial [Candidatus Nanoarchaeia archaeon]|nr:family 10 glycosylhydrolase [Candidatus Nanoarchaeia archaeon]